MKEKRKSNVALEGADSSRLVTEARVYELADRIVNSGWTKWDCLNFIMDNWDVKKRQAERYYYGALHYMQPQDPEKYREALINKNYSILETLLKKAVDSNNLKVANEIIKTMNQMVGLGTKQVEIEDKNSNNVIKISFGD